MNELINIKSPDGVILVEEGIVYDEISRKWIVRSEDMATLMEFDTFVAAVLYAVTVEGWR